MQAGRVRVAPVPILLAQVTEATVAGFLVRLREGDADHPALSSTSAARTVVAVRGFHRFAVADGLATTDPASVPRITGTAQMRSTPMSTVPRRRCSRTETMEVGMMTASEVPTAVGIATSGAWPRSLNTS